MTARIPLPLQLRFAAFSVAAGRTAGLGRKRMRGADLQSPFHGVRTTATAFEVIELCRAYQARMSASAFFSGMTAAVILGVPLPFRLESSRTLRVSVPAPHRAPSGRGIVGSTVTASPDDVQLSLGMRVSSPARVWCELGSVLAVPDLVAAGDYLVHRERALTTIDELARMIEAHSGHRGIRNLREALPLLSERAESRRESLLRVILIRGAIAGVVANLPIRTSSGFNYRADLAIPERKVVIEYQSDYHRDIAQFRLDMTRRGRLEADGWLVILVNADDLLDPLELVQRIRSTIAARPAT